VSDTEQQLSEALTAFSVAHRVAAEALINRVTSIITLEQIERLKLQEFVDEIDRRVRGLEGILDRRGKSEP
jgi:hypothetical protein